MTRGWIERERESINLLRKAYYILYIYRRERGKGERKRGEMSERNGETFQDDLLNYILRLLLLTL